MKATEAIRIVMKECEVGVSKLANRLNIIQPLVSQRLQQQNISVKLLSEMLRVLDYKVVVMPSDSPTPKDGIEVE